MSHSRSFVRPCAEFPNDNPLLHDGVSWVCLRVGAPLRPIARARLEPSAAHLAERPSSLALAGSAPRTMEGATPFIQAAAPDQEAASEVVTALAPEAEAVPAQEAEVAITAELAEVDVAAFVAQGSEATAPPPSVFALSTEIAGAGVPDVGVEEHQGGALEAPPDESDPRFEDLAIELTPARSEVRVVAQEDLQLDDMDDADDGFSFDGGTDVDFENTPDASAAPADGSPGRAAEAAPAPDPSPSVVEPAAPASTFHAFVAAVAEVALAAGAASAAAVLPALLAGEPVTGDGLTEAMRRAPSAAASVFDHTAGQVRLSARYLRTGEAWSAVLRGDAGDMSACGTSTLDGWAGEILRGLGVGADGAVDVKRELRRRGVAAFGMLIAA